jgi:hypothetical protein
MIKNKSFAQKKKEDDALGGYKFPPLTDSVTTGAYSSERNSEPTSIQNDSDQDCKVSEERRNALVDSSGNLEKKTQEISAHFAIKQEWYDLKEIERKIEQTENFLEGSEERVKGAVEVAMTKYKETHYPNPSNRDLVGDGLPPLNAKFRDTQLRSTPTTTPRISNQTPRPLTAQSSKTKQLI